MNYGEPMTAKLSRRPFQCAVKRWAAKRKMTTQIVENPVLIALQLEAPDKCHFWSHVQKQTRFRQYNIAPATKFTQHEQTAKHKTQWHRHKQA